MSYRYTLEGYSSGFVYPRRIDKGEKFFKFEEMEFPVDAYRKLCKRLKLQFPLDDVADTQTETSHQPKALAPDDQAIIEGLTVADVRRMCERSGALASVLRVVAQWQAIEKENPERMTTDVLLSKLKIAARKDGWGTDKKGELAVNSQAEPLKKMILDEWRPGGRPRKDSNN
jgi:hypothetical protein